MKGKACLRIINTCFVHSPIYVHGLYLRQELPGKDEEICRFLMKKSASRPMINIMSV